jgi:hypothetical protein
MRGLRYVWFMVEQAEFAQERRVQVLYFTV